MTENGWQNVKKIFIAALEKDASRRTFFLDEACADDPDLREEVESLLHSHEEIENFIEEPAFNVGEVFKDGSNREENHFGNYKIIREIGAGGMGVVFLAERTDGEFEQKVAIKIIRQAIAESELVSRFKRERQILASLNHPNIAKLLDGGVSENRLPFLAMEYIEGESITKFVELKNLDVEERLKLFLKVCAVVAYAHRNLVVHRDLKPGNILVTDEGEPKLLDFGLAKLLDENLSTDATQTQTAFRALTPAYASPEQLKNEPLTTASDIYSLGVVFYELLTGARPFHFEGKSLEEIINTVSQSQPPLPSVNPQSEIRNPLLKGDLDNIALMALRKEPERRYQSVEQFADDIERHLNGLPVRARPNTFSYRAEKFVKRNRLSVAAGLLILLTLIGGIAATLWQARRAEQQRESAERRFNEVRRLSNSLLFEIHDSVQNLQGSTPTRQLIVSRALEYLDPLAREAGNDASLQLELATAYEKIGDIQGNPYSANLGDTKGALESYRKAVVIRENLSKTQPTVESQMGLGRSYRALGDIMDVESNTAEMNVDYRRSLDIFEQLANQNPTDAAVRDELARAYETLGDGLSKNENSAAETLENYRKTLAIREDLIAQNPSDNKMRRSLAIILLKVGRTTDAKNKAQAIENINRGIQIYQDLAAQEPNNAHTRREIGLAYFLLGNILNDAGDNAAALNACRKSLAVRREIAAQDPQNKQARFDLAVAHATLSEFLTGTGKTAQALSEARQALDIMQELTADDPANIVYQRNTALAYEKFGLALAHSAGDGKTPAAQEIKQWNEALDWYQKAFAFFAAQRESGTLQPRDIEQIEKFSAKIETCRKSLEQLNASLKR